MRTQRKLAGVLLILIPTAAQSQFMPYMDAENEDQAAGIMMTTLIAVDISKSECSTRFTELTTKIRRNESIWRQRDHAAIRQAERILDEFESQNRELVQKKREYVAGAIRQQFALMNAPEAGVEGEIVFRSYCENYFSDLASGVWRSRTPNVYRFLEEDGSSPPTQ